jgi:hypothetical protein
MLSPLTDGAHSTPVGSRVSSLATVCSVQVLSGVEKIQSAQAQIAELRERTGQTDNPLLSLDFFLGRVSLFPGNQPVVLLVCSAERLEGAVYLYEKTFCGIPTGYLRAFDHFTGESSVIAPEPVRGLFLQVAIHQLFLKTNARVAWATVCHGANPLEGSLQEFSRPHVEAKGTFRKHRLKLAPTFDATLGRFGPHIRRNLRYYRRRAEKELSATFHPVLTLEESDEALQHLQISSFQPFPVSLTQWRKMDGLLRTRPSYFAMGLRTNGEWISYLVGMRTGKITHVLMQINHNGFARYSLSTVMRSHFFEHEIGRGQEEVKFVNGTCALFQSCCECDLCITVSAHRGLTAYVLFNWIAPWYSAPDHALNMRRWDTKPLPAPFVDAGVFSTNYRSGQTNNRPRLPRKTRFSVNCSDPGPPDA